MKAVGEVERLQGVAGDVSRATATERGHLSNGSSGCQPRNSKRLMPISLVSQPNA